MVKVSGKVLVAVLRLHQGSPQNKHLDSWWEEFHTVPKHDPRHAQRSPWNWMRVTSLFGVCEMGLGYDHSLGDRGLATVIFNTLFLMLLRARLRSIWN